MQKRELDYQRSPALLTMAKAVLIGFVIGESVFAALMVSQILFSAARQHRSVCWILLIELIFAAAIGVFYFIRYGSPTARKVMVSGRIDLLASLILGGIAAYMFPRLGSSIYSPVLASVSPEQYIALVAIPLVLVPLHLLRALILTHYFPPKASPAVFVNDLEKTTRSEDLLNFKNNAQRFAERVLNGGSSDSMVFGIDAPWGSGKSSFVNFCIEYWRDQASPDVVIFLFNPLQYDDRKHLLQKFIDGLIITIREHVFIPELRAVVSRYSKLVSAKKPISIGGVEFSFATGDVSIERATGDLRFALSNLCCRLVVIVDDLDRIEFSALKDILFVIKKGFSLPNVSFVLCYDSQSIATLEGVSVEQEKISEFLEKFINVKVGLYLSSADLQRYVSENLKIALAANRLADFRLIDVALGGLRQIYDSNDYHRYLPFFGDVRKIKRFLNILILLDINQTDYKNSDFNQWDLLLLLLLYLNYPSLFRDIYNAETYGRGEVFSLIRGYEENRSHYKNSDEYKDRVEGLKNAGRLNEAFLLAQIFGVERLKSNDPSEISEEDHHTLACFNATSGPSRRNLEAYLNLIVLVSKPPKREQYRFYVNAKDQILGGTSIESVLSDIEFDPVKGEYSHEQIWRVLVNSLDEFNGASIAPLISHAANRMDVYSTLQIPKLSIGLRHSSMPYTILRLLDAVGWEDSNGANRDNSLKNLTGITDWIYGQGQRAGHGILETLFNSQRGILGLHDVLILRLYSCVDRNSEGLFNLSRALSHHSDPTAPTTGVTSEIVVPEMREMSQTIFAMFREQYIRPRRNLLLEADSLTLPQLAGAFHVYLEKEVEEERYDAEKLQALSPSCIAGLKGFIVYQLANTLISMGIGCGFYDEEGSDDTHGIAGAMNDYLFDICFDAGAGGFEVFLDYLFTTFRLNFGFGVKKAYLPSLDEICTVLDRVKLRQYWITHRKAVRAQNYETKDKKIYTPNYTASYSEDLPALYAELDKLDGQTKSSKLAPFA